MFWGLHYSKGSYNTAVNGSHLSKIYVSQNSNHFVYIFDIQKYCGFIFSKNQIDYIPTTALFDTRASLGILSIYVWVEAIGWNWKNV